MSWVALSSAKTLHGTPSTGSSPAAEAVAGTAVRSGSPLKLRRAQTSSPPDSGSNFRRSWNEVRFEKVMTLTVCAGSRVFSESGVWGGHQGRRSLAGRTHRRSARLHRLRQLEDAVCEVVAHVVGVGEGLGAGEVAANAFLALVDAQHAYHGGRAMHRELGRPHDGLIAIAACSRRGRGASEQDEVSHRSEGPGRAFSAGTAAAVT